MHPLNTNKVKNIAETFAYLFREDELRVPDVEIMQKNCGRTESKHGFSPVVSYVFGYDSIMGDYMEIYAQGAKVDQHIRIYEDGSYECIEALEQNTERANTSNHEINQPLDEHHSRYVRIFKQLKIKGL